MATNANMAAIRPQVKDTSHAAFQLLRFSRSFTSSLVNMHQLTLTLVIALIPFFYTINGLNRYIKLTQKT